MARRLRAAAGFFYVNQPSGPWADFGYIEGGSWDTDTQADWRFWGDRLPVGAQVARALLVLHASLYDFDTAVVGPGQGDPHTMVLCASINGNEGRAGLIDTFADNTAVGGSAGCPRTISATAAYSLNNGSPMETVP